MNPAVDLRFFCMKVQTDVHSTIGIVNLVENCNLLTQTDRQMTDRRNSGDECNVRSNVMLTNCCVSNKSGEWTVKWVILL